MISVGPTGRTVRGDVLDVNKAALERALRQYDSLLYIAWNPKKRQGMGCWEIRRRPEKKTAIHQGSWNGLHFFELKYKELNVVHHVLDVPVLNYDVLARIKKMDTWDYKDFGREVDYREAEYDERIESKAQEEMRYMIKQHKSEVRDLKEMLLSGMNPAQIAKHWGRS
jgi:hypothetical protein